MRFCSFFLFFGLFFTASFGGEPQITEDEVVDILSKEMNPFFAPSIRSSVSKVKPFSYRSFVETVVGLTQGMIDSRKKVVIESVVEIPSSWWWSFFEFVKQNKFFQKVEPLVFRMALKKVIRHNALNKESDLLALLQELTPGFSRSSSQKDKKSNQKDERPKSGSLEEALLKKMGLHSGASREEVRSAYRSFALRFHPDKGEDPKKFMMLQSVYEQIKEIKGWG